MDTEYMRTKSVFGRRVSPGPLTFIVSEGLAIQTGLIHHTGMAFLEMTNMKMPNPCFCGDTIRVEMKVVEKRESKKLDRGVVIFHHIVRKQTGEVVMEMTKVRLIRRMPAEEQAEAKG